MLLALVPYFIELRGNVTLEPKLDTYWILLDTFGYFWIRLDTFGYFWILLDTFGYIFPQHVIWGPGLVILSKKTICCYVVGLNSMVFHCNMVVGGVVGGVVGRFGEG